MSQQNAKEKPGLQMPEDKEDVPMLRGKQFLAFMFSTVLAIGSLQMPVFAVGYAATDYGVESLDEVTEDSGVSEEDNAAGVQESDDEADSQVNEDEAAMPESVDEPITSYTVTLDANGGYFLNEWDDVLNESVETTEILNKKIPIGESVTTFPVYEQTDPKGNIQQMISFVGWSLERDGQLVTEEYKEYIPVANCVLFARWKSKDEISKDTDKSEKGDEETDNEILEDDDIPDIDEDSESDSISAIDSQDTEDQNNSEHTEEDNQKRQDENDSASLKDIQENKFDNEQDKKTPQTIGEKPSGIDKSIQGESDEQQIMEDGIDETVAVDAKYANSASEVTREEAVEWVYSKEGKYLDYDGAYGCQCVDFIKYYYAYFGQASYAKGNGCDYVNNTLPPGWIRIKNTADFIPEKGDIAVWGTELSGYGHVAIVLSANSSSFVSMDQNWPKGTGCKQVTHSYNKFWGVIRPNFKIGNPIPPTNLYINTDKVAYAVGETVTFSFYSENASTLAIPIDVNGKREFFNFVNGQTSYSTSFNVPGQYGYFLYGTNNYGEASSEYKEFYIYDECPKDLSITVDKQFYAVGENVTFNFDSKYATSLAIPIDVNGKREYFIYVNGQTSYVTSFNVPGQYGYFLYGTNEYGQASAEYREFYVYDQKPQRSSISVDKKNYQIGETVQFIMDSDMATGFTIGIDDSSDNRIDTYDITNTNTYSRVFNEPGNYSCYVTAYNNYGWIDSERIWFNIYIADFSEDSITISGIDSKTYTGFAQTQNPTVMVGDKTLTNGTDYMLSYANNTNAGTATVTITGKGNFKGTVSKTFTINAASILNADVTGITNKAYTGAAQIQNPTVKVGDRTLANGTDYTLAYSNNTNVGTATVTITGKGNYTGTVSRTFAISGVSIANATVTGISNKTYTGSAQMQAPTVKVGDKTLTNGTDYALSYSNNTNAGTATVTITGKGNYSGAVSKTFTINAASITNADVTGITNKAYIGSAQTQNPTVKIGNRTLVNGTDYTLSYSNNTNVGTATVTITGKGNYTGSISRTFSIGGTSIANATVTGISNKIYNGSSQTQNPTVKVGDKTLTNGTDYTLSYSNNINAGTATVTIAGKGNYTESLSKTFTISVASIANATVTGISNKTYNSSAQTQNPTVKVGDKTLANGTDYTLSYSNNINAGTATITITGKGNYAESLNKTFTVGAASIANADITGISNKAYTGSAQTQNPTVKVEGRTLTNGTDYTLSYSNNTNAGTATVTITGKGNYTGTVSRTFAIGGTSIANATVTGISNKTYNGSAQTQNPTIKDGDKTLANGTDYTLSYSNNINAGTATVTIAGKGNYTESLSKTFTISAASIVNATVTGISNKTYNGSAQMQAPTVKVGDKTLTNGTDYTLSYSNNTNAGTATVTITGKGNYAGTVSKTFTISAASIANATVTEISNKTYSGLAQTQNPTVNVGDKPLTNGTDYTLSYLNNFNAGTATVTITGKGNYSGSLSRTFTISAASIANADVTEISNKAYTGSAQTQNPTVKIGDRTLVNGTDYTLAYSNNTNAGTATVTIIGKGNYTGIISRAFTIGGISIAAATVTGISNKTYNGTAQTQNPTITIDGKTLTIGTDYTLSYANNINVGTATVTITGKGNYAEPVSKTFMINAASIANADIAGISDKAYTGSAQTQNPTVKIGDRTLENGTDYTLAYSNNTNVGTATVTITGKGNYTGTVSRTFTIGGISIASATVTGISNRTYNGSAQTQNPTVKIGDKTLTNETDYTLFYANNTNAGTATMMITGKGSYAGTVSKTFTISAASIADATITGISNKTYDGSAQTQNPAIKFGNMILVNGTDYTLSYANNTNIGTATVTIAGNGNFSGTLSRTFTIGGISIASATVTGIANKTFNGSAQTQNLTVKAGSKTLKNGTDYTLSYANNTKAGTATVTITGKGNYTGTLSKNFTISAASIVKAAVTGISNKTYNGAAQTQKPSVKVGGKTLKNGNDYKLSYAKNKNVGTATVTITGKGNYTGTVKKTFLINPKPTKLSKLTAGSKQFTVKWAKQASQTTGYQIQYSSRSDFKSQKTVTVSDAGKTSKSVSGLLKKQKYYVRVRTYKIIGKKKYYSTWSAVKTVMTK